MCSAYRSGPGRCAETRSTRQGRVRRLRDRDQQRRVGRAGRGALFGHVVQQQHGTGQPDTGWLGEGHQHEDQRIEDD
jgi:hypothetical protein